MNNLRDKRHTQDMALKDAMAAQVLALSDDEVAQETRLRGDDPHAAEARIRMVHDKVKRIVGGGSSGAVVAIESVRMTPTNQQLPARHRLARPTRLAASAEPPSHPQATDALESPDRQAQAADEDTDQSKP